jgi:hypothetical protein
MLMEIRVDFAGRRSTYYIDRGNEAATGPTGPDGRRHYPNEGETTMRVMVMIKADEQSEAGVMPSQQLLKDMGKYNEELVKAGVMLAGEGLHPSSKGKRVHFTVGGKPRVIDGPFTEAKELIAGFWLWQVKDMDEAVEWVKRMPTPADAPSGAEGVIEIRPVFEADDFGAEFTPELRAQEDRLREELAAKTKQ